MGHPAKLNERIKDLQAIALPGQTRESKSFCNIDKTWSIKQRILTRRLRLMATGQLYPVRPSFLMPSMTARTEAAVRNVLLPWAALWQNITIG
jgi:hypothetical protein